jgi:hypothetical protein
VVREGRHGGPIASAADVDNRVPGPPIRGFPIDMRSALAWQIWSTNRNRPFARSPSMTVPVTCPGRRCHAAHPPHLALPLSCSFAHREQNPRPQALQPLASRGRFSVSDVVARPAAGRKPISHTPMRFSDPGPAVARGPPTRTGNNEETVQYYGPRTALFSCCPSWRPPSIHSPRPWLASRPNRAIPPGLRNKEIEPTSTWLVTV